MLTRKIYQGAFLLGLIFLGASPLIGCGPKQTAAVKTADHIPVGTMPDGGDWEGVYYDQVFGFLHITVSGGAATGAWRTTAGDKWGEMHGEIEGDLIRYQWIERKVGVVGPGAKSEGKGYFKYTIPKADEPHVIKGEWGLHENEVGHGWEALKQMNVEPDPKSVRPDEMESRVGATGFDGAKGDEDIGSVNKDKKEQGQGKEKKEEEGAPEPL